jgi:protease-4
VDEFGGLDHAIRIAAKRANLTEYRITELPAIKDPFEKILENFGQKPAETILKQYMGKGYEYYHKIDRLMHLEPYQARMPYELEIY